MASTAFDHAEDAHCDPAALGASVAELANLPPIESVLKLKEVAREYKISSSNLDKLVRAKRKADKERADRAQTEAAFAARAREKAKAEAEPKPALADDSSIIAALYEKAKPILEADDPLAKVDEKIEALGYAGDRVPTKLVYITGLSALLRHPLKTNLQGPSAAGKNFAVNTGLKPLPPAAFYKFSASSPMALIYSPQSFEHIAIVVGEADSLPTEGPPASAMRSLVEDDEMRYPTVDRDPETNQMTTREIVKKGPTAAITTSTKPLEWQMSTRFIAADIPDDPEQTLAVLLAEAAAANQLEDVADPSLEPFHAAYFWLKATGVKNVAVPFSSSLARLVPRKDVRIRRDFKQVLAVTQTIAFLAQAKRVVCDGWVVATLEDYERARSLLAPALDTHTNDGISDAIRKTVGAIQPDETLSLPELGSRMGVTKSTAHYRSRRAIAYGYVVNVEERKGHPMKLQLGDPLPAKASVLPTVEELKAQVEEDGKAASQAAQDDEVIPF